MTTIPNIVLTQDEYKQLLKQEQMRGGEAIISSSGNPNTRYKLFMNQPHYESPMNENKTQKIIELHRRQIKHLVRPLSTISFNGKMVGYEMTYDKFDKSLESLTFLPRKTLIKVLKDTKEILEYLNSEGITYGDVTTDNILVNIKTGVVKFCDIDNMQVGENPIDIKGFSLSRYYSKTGIIDSKADAFMHNLLTIKKLAAHEKFESTIMQELERGIYPTRFKQGAKPIFESMATPEKFTGEYVVQYVKR